MKTTIILLALALGSVLPGMAADTSATTFSVAGQQSHQPRDKQSDKSKMTAQFANPFALVEKGDNHRIDRIGGMSSRPWTQIAFSEAGGSPVFKDPMTHESQLRLFWIGAEPRP